LVASDRLPNWPRNKLQFPWFGPFRVVEVFGGSCSVRVSPRMGGLLQVGFSHLKHFWEEMLLSEDPEENSEVCQKAVQAAEEDMDLDPAGEDAEEVSAAGQREEDEKSALGVYFVEAILRHDYKQGWRFLTKWVGYSATETTWEPTRSFSLGGGQINDVFEQYCKANELTQPLAQCKNTSLKQKAQ
jgi:''chromo'' (CHRromatin Organisation MOdifier) domain.